MIHRNVEKRGAFFKYTFRKIGKKGGVLISSKKHTKVCVFKECK